MKVRTQGLVVKMVVILVEEEKMREMLVVVPWVMVMFFGYDIRGDVGCYLRVLSVMGWGNMGMKYTQKAVGTAGGFALVGMVVPLCLVNSYRVAAACGHTTIGFYLLNAHGDEINTKSRGHCWRLRLGGAGGADSRKTSFPSCRHRHPHRHAVHDASNDHGKKSRRWR